MWYLPAVVPLAKEHNKNKCKIFLSYEEGLGQFGLFSQKRKPQSNLIVTLPIPNMGLPDGCRGTH